MQTVFNIKTSPTEIPELFLNQTTSVTTSSGSVFMDIPSHLLGSHSANILNLICSNDYKDGIIHIVKKALKLTIDPDAFSSSKNSTTLLTITRCDLEKLDFSFLKGFHRLEKIEITNPFNIGKADWGRFPSLPALQTLFINDGNPSDLNGSRWVDNLPSLHNGLSHVTFQGIGFSGDEVADRLTQWLIDYSIETLQTISIQNWFSLTRLPRRLFSSFKQLLCIDFSCGNYKIDVIEEGAIDGVSASVVVAVQNCGIREIKRDAFRGRFSIIVDTIFFYSF